MLPDALVDCGARFLVLPGSEPARTDEDGASPARFESLLELFLPGIAGDEMPLVEEDLEPVVAQTPRERLDRRLVGAGVAEEDIVVGHHPGSRRDSMAGPASPTATPRPEGTVER
jgi:hypothetical protein